MGGTDWLAWHRDYDDPDSSLSRRLEVVREELAAAIERADTGQQIRLVSLCSGDGRDTLPVLAAAESPVSALLVELDPGLAEAARQQAVRLGLAQVDVRTADAGLTGSFADRLPTDVLMLCGVFGNVADTDVRRTVAHVPAMLAPGGVVVWTRGRCTGDDDPTEVAGDPAEWVRTLCLVAGLDEVAHHRSDAGFRVGVHRLSGAATRSWHHPERLFSFANSAQLEKNMLARPFLRYW